MRILFVSNYFPPYEKGGYEQLCRDVALILQERSHEIAVLTSDHGSPEPVQQPISAYRILRISPDYASSMSLPAQFLFKRKQIEKHNLQVLKTCAGAFRPDVIFIWNLQGIPRSLATGAESLPNQAVVYWLAGYSPAEPDEYWNFWTRPGAGTIERLSKNLLAFIALRQLQAEGKPIRPKLEHTAVVSEFMRQKGIREGTLPMNCSVIYNGVEIDAFYRPVRTVANRIKILQAGRLSYNKGAHISIKALHQIVNGYGYRDIQLTFAGSGEPRDQAWLTELIGRYRLEKHIEFVGYQPREQMAKLMHQHHILLLPTIQQEAFARVVLEAMASGLAVVAADTGGTSEIVQHNVTGLLCRPNDEIMLAEQIRRLIVEPHLREEVAHKGQKRVVENFSLENMVDALENLLASAVLLKSIT